MIKGMIGRMGLLLLRNIEVRNGICVESLMVRRKQLCGNETILQPTTKHTHN